MTTPWIHVPNDAWRWHALCAQVDPELFYPEPKRATTNQARRVCMLCPVRSECLADALARDERFGVWGGTSEKQRRKLQAGAS